MDNAVEEIMAFKRSLPARPDINAVAAARGVTQKLEKENQLKIEGLEKQIKGKDTPDELFIILQEMKRNVIRFQSNDHKREAQKLLDLDELHSVIDVLIQKASHFVQSQDYESSPAIDDHMSLNKTYNSEGERIGLKTLLRYIDQSAIKGNKDLILRRTLSDQIDKFPNSLAKLSCLINLDLSENKIVTLPDSIGRLFTLLHLNVKSNSLSSLPSSIGNLVRLRDLDLGSNTLTSLPETLGSLTNLQRLKCDINDIDEIPYTIGHCSSLKELRADYNRIKALPEAIGKLESLEILTVRYNNIKHLPTTMASLSSLIQFDISFNEVESICESLCLIPKLMKLDISNNFSELISLPKSIGKMESLQELICNNNQIRNLPDSFGSLYNLVVLNIDGNPVKIPPKDVVEMGAQAVVKYIHDLGDKRKMMKKKSSKPWARIWFLSHPKKHKR